MENKWNKLYAIATSEPEGDAAIKPTENIDEVILIWPDKSESFLCWKYENWEWPERINVFPCDVKARDCF